MTMRFGVVGWTAILGVLAIPLIAGAYESAPVSNGAVLSGKVTFKGSVPPAKIFKIAKNPEVCGKHPSSTADGNRMLQEVRSRGGLLQDVVIFIEGVDKGKPFDFGGTDFVAKDCEFTPYVSVGVKNGPYRVENRDEVIHNPHTYEILGAARRTLLNQPLPNKGDRLDKPLKVLRGKVVKLECDQHDFMHNWIKVVDNPYYAIVGGDGEFKIDEIPPGFYKIVAWHPILGEQVKEVTFTAEGKTTLNFGFSGK
jgi:hypothetical protein